MAIPAPFPSTKLEQQRQHELIPISRSWLYLQGHYRQKQEDGIYGTRWHSRARGSVTKSVTRGQSRTFPFWDPLPLFPYHKGLRGQCGTLLPWPWVRSPTRRSTYGPMSLMKYFEIVFWYPTDSIISPRDYWTSPSYTEMPGKTPAWPMSSHDRDSRGPRRPRKLTKTGIESLCSPLAISP